MHSQKYGKSRPAVCNVLVVLSACRGKRHLVRLYSLKIIPTFINMVQGLEIIPALHNLLRCDTA